MNASFADTSAILNVAGKQQDRSSAISVHYVFPPPTLEPGARSLVLFNDGSVVMDHVSAGTGTLLFAGHVDAVDDHAMVITPNSNCLVADPIVASLRQVDIIPVHTWNMPSFASLTIPELPPRLKRKRDLMHLRNASAVAGDTPDVPATAPTTVASQPPNRQRTTQPAAALPASGLSILTKTRLHRQEIRSGASSQRGNTAIRSTRRSTRRAKAADQSVDVTITRIQDNQPSTSPNPSSKHTGSLHDHLRVPNDSTVGGAEVVVAAPGGGEAAGETRQTTYEEPHSTAALHQPVSVDDESVDELEGHAETGDGRIRGRSEELVEEALAQGGGAL